MIFKDYYKILGFETNKVTIDDIKIGFRDQAKKYHPDMNEGSNSAEERFKDINEAYRVLSNPTSRKKYDRTWNNYIGKKKNKEENGKNINHSDTIFGEVMNMFFGAKKENEEAKPKKGKVQIKGENVETAINLSIEEAYFGGTKKISLRAINGKMKNFTIKIPPGIRNDEKIRLMGQGKPGEHGGKNGDLLIRINIEDNKKFRLEGCNLYTDLNLTPWEAALGARINIDSIDGQETVYVQKGIQTGDRIRLAQKGYKDGKGGRGDLIAEAKIMIPKNLSEDEMQIYQKLKEVSNFNPR